VFNNSLAIGAFLWHYQVAFASRASNYFPVSEDMIMRRWAFASLLLIVIAASAVAQVQTVGDVSFAVPEGWAYQGSTDGGLMLLKQGTNFWIVTVHALRPASGNSNADFKNAWLGVVSTIPDFQRSLPGYDPYTTSNKLLGYPGKYFDAISDSGKMYARLYTLECAQPHCGGGGEQRARCAAQGFAHPQYHHHG
jgi:hypothetical protein